MIRWQSLATRDPYLSGHIAARDTEWWDRPLAEEAAASVALTGEKLATFLAGWQESLRDLEQERAVAARQELNQFLDSCADGYDPAARTQWKGQQL